MMHDMAGNASMLELHEVETSIRKGLGAAEKADAGGRLLSDSDLVEIEAAVAEARKVTAALQDQFIE